MATINSRTLKLYIDSTSMSLAHQMADLVRHASDSHCIKLITWLRLPLTEQQLKQHQALYFPQMAAISPDFINLACKIIRDHRITHLNIHSNQTHAWRGVFPLLRALRQLKMDEALDITLDLYDDGTLSLMQREQLKCLPTLEQDVVKAAQALKTALSGGGSVQSDPTQSHAWHLVYPTRYHVFRLGALSDTAQGRHLRDWLAPHAAEMQFSAFPVDLTDDQRSLYLTLFGLTEATREALHRFAREEGAFLYTGTGSWDRGMHDELCRRQVRAIGALHAQKRLSRDMQIAYKGHPANRANDADIMKALGGQAVPYPHQIPLEVLSIAGLLPRRVGGVLSSSSLNIEPGRIAFILYNDRAEERYSDTSLANLVKKLDLVPADRMLPLMVQEAQEAPVSKPPAVRQTLQGAALS